MSITWINSIPEHFFEISEIFCSPASQILRTLANRLQKKFRKSIGNFKIRACKKFSQWDYIRTIFCKLEFKVPDFRFSKKNFCNRFLRLCRMCSAGEQKFSEISNFVLRSIYGPSTLYNWHPTVMSELGSKVKPALKKSAIFKSEVQKTKST